MIKNIIEWGKKSSINVSIIGMVIMLSMEAILVLPVLIPLVNEYGWFSPLPTKYVMYFAASIVVSFWVAFEICLALFKNKK